MGPTLVNSDTAIRGSIQCAKISRQQRHVAEHPRPSVSSDSRHPGARCAALSRQSSASGRLKSGASTSAFRRACPDRPANARLDSRRKTQRKATRPERNDPTSVTPRSKDVGGLFLRRDKRQFADLCSAQLLSSIAGSHVVIEPGDPALDEASAPLCPPSAWMRACVRRSSCWSRRAHCSTRCVHMLSEPGSERLRANARSCARSSSVKINAAFGLPGQKDEGATSR